MNEAAGFSSPENTSSEQANQPTGWENMDVQNQTNTKATPAEAPQAETPAVESAPTAEPELPAGPTETVAETAILDTPKEEITTTSVATEQLGTIPPIPADNNGIELAAPGVTPPQPLSMETTASQPEIAAEATTAETTEIKDGQDTIVEQTEVDSQAVRNDTIENTAADAILASETTETPGTPGTPGTSATAETPQLTPTPVPAPEPPTTPSTPETTA